MQGAFQQERGAADIPYLLRLLFEQAGRPSRGDQLLATADWAKMYDRILGFQRLFWCPKWTPASSRDFMVMGLGPATVVSSLVSSTTIQPAFPGRVTEHPGFL